METNIKAEIDKITSIADLDELIKYIKERKRSLKLTLHDILEPYFKEHSETWFFILGYYGKNEEGSVYTGGFDLDYLNVLDYDLKDNKKYLSNECLNCAIFGSTIKELKSYEEVKELIEKIKGAKDFPEISETKAFFELSYDDEVILIYDYKENKICQE